MTTRDKSSELVEIQAVPSALQPSVVETRTDMVMPPRRNADRLRHFSEGVYDLNPESHLSRFMKVLMGDAGAGALRKRLLIQRMRSALQGTHFYDLDRFYGPLFGLKRSPDEVLQINPYEAVATKEQWDDVYARDASFRSRIEQFSRAIAYGPTPVGMELLAEALLSADVEINEGFVTADRPYQTYAELMALYGTPVNSEGMISVESDITDWNGGSNTVPSQSTDWAYPDGFTSGGGVNSIRIPLWDIILEDDFTGNTIDSMKWTASGFTQDDQLESPLDSAATIYTDPFSITTEVVRLTMEVKQILDSPNDDPASMSLGISDSLQGFFFSISYAFGDPLMTLSYNDGSSQSAGSVAYDPVAHRWLRIMVDPNGDVGWWAAPAESGPWTLLGSVAYFSPGPDPIVVFSADGDDDTTQPLIIDNVSLVETFPDLTIESDPVSIITDEVIHTFSAVLYSGAPRDVTASIIWSDDSPSVLSTSDGDPVSVPVNKATQAFVSDEAPATTDTAVLKVFIEGSLPGNDDYIYLDRLVLSRYTYSDMQGVDYATLEGYGLDRMRHAGRRTFTVRPKRHISLAEAYDLSRVLDKLKPADTRFVIITKGIPLHDPLPIRATYADSVHWEINQKVVATSAEANLPYLVQSPDPVEQPRPPFSGYQGEAWSYITDLAGVSASYVQDGVPAVAPPQKITYRDGTSIVFSAEQAILPANLVQSGRSISDAILVGFPYATKLGNRSIARFNDDDDPLQKLYVDGVPIKPLNRSLSLIQRVDPFQQNPESRFWVSIARAMEDQTEEIIEVRMTHNSWVNYVTFEMAKYPQALVCEVFDLNVGDWVEAFSYSIDLSVPAILNPGSEFGMTSGHPQHNQANHWQRVSQRIEPRFTRRIRLKMRRIAGTPPYKILHTSDRNSRQNPPKEPVNYSVAIRSWDVGYRITSRNDFDFIEGNAIGQTIDYLGSQVQFESLEHVPARAIDGSDETAWKSEPQPVNYAVVNFYLDTRTEDGTDGEVIDRFFLNPTHAGPNLSIYYSNDPDVPDGTTEFMEQRTWIPIPRNYTLQKGYVHIPTTRARFFKFEFSSLVAEPYESFVSILRRVKLFPSTLIKELATVYGQAEEARLPGMSTAIETAAEIRYRDAIEALLVAQEETLLPTDDTQFRPTEALWINNVEGAQRVQDEAWQFQFTPWHQDDGQYPRFNKVGTHTYETVEVRHSSKVGFFVGLRSIEAYRTKYEKDENTTVYLDTFDDFRNLDIGSGITWVIEPGYLHSEGTSPPVVATSRTFYSREPVEAMQFATVQSDPVQLVPDHFFQSPALANYTWDNEDSFQAMGDVTLIYNPSEYSVSNFRYVTPIQKALDRVGGIVQPVVQPVFGERPFEVRDSLAEAATFGGMRTPLMALSEKGRAYAAVRFTMMTDQTAPLILRVYDDTDSDAVLAERVLTGKRGELVEEFVGFDIPDSVTVVWASLTQEGKTYDQWKVHALSVFDDAIFWEFSNNGGGDWYPAVEIKNNENGILTFPKLGTQLRYRVTAYRVNRWISAIKIRPHYVAYGNARPTGTHRGPNVSLYDHDVPIQDDPLFTTWSKPIPYWWFAESRRFPLLSVEGAQQQTVFNSFYGRPTADTISGLADAATGEVTAVRSVEERLDFLHPTLDNATRSADMERLPIEDVSGLTDSAIAWIVIGENDPLNAPIPDDV